MGQWLWPIVWSFVGALIAILFVTMVAMGQFRSLIQRLMKHFITTLMNERYPENIWEMVTALTRTSPTKVVENSLRAASGATIERPFGSPRKFLHYDGLIFSPAQLAILPAHEDDDVDMSITIGPAAKKPLKLDIPIMCGAMGYGIGVSERVKIAIARGTAAVGSLTNTGEGGFLPEERSNAKYLIIQYNSGHWSKEPAILQQADAIEIHIGQGATAGTASVIPPEFITGRARQIMKLQGNGPTIIPARHAEIKRPEDLGVLVNKLRGITGGVPIGVKICASARLEDDLEISIRANVDFISIDGGQAGTKGGPPILEDDFGLPTIYAVCRAIRYLQQRGVKERISLLSGGGYSTPGECLKALALGADGIFMGTSLLWAMTHDQVTKAIPWEPPTQLTYYPGDMDDQFDVDKAAQSLQKFFTAYTEEMKLGIRALGKSSLRDLNPGDLVALDETTSQVTHVPLAYGPLPQRAAQGAAGGGAAAGAGSMAGAAPQPAAFAGGGAMQPPGAGQQRAGGGAASPAGSAGSSAQRSGSGLSPMAQQAPAGGSAAGLATGAGLAGNGGQMRSPGGGAASPAGSAGSSAQRSGSGLSPMAQQAPAGGSAAGLATGAGLAGNGGQMRSPGGGAASPAGSAGSSAQRSGSGFSTGAQQASAGGSAAGLATGAGLAGNGGQMRSPGGFAAASPAASPASGGSSPRPLGRRSIDWRTFRSKI